MAGLIQILNKDYSDIAKMTKGEYKDFLEKTMRELLEDESFARFKVVRERQYFRFFLYPPNVEDIEYIEGEEQRDGRLELLNSYRDKYNQEVATTSGTAENSLSKEDWIEALRVQEFIGVTKRTLYNLVDDENSELKIKSINRELMVDRESLITYLNRRHIIGTEIGFEKMYKTVKSLSVKGTNTIDDINRKKLDEILASEEYESLWRMYLETVPEDRRIYREKEKKDVDGYMIHSLEGMDEENLFDVYNPNIMVSPEPIKEIPQMYAVNYVAAVMDTTPRTILRYCEYGYIPYFKIGGKYMFSFDDFAKSKEQINSKKSLSKKNVGRKRKIEHIFGDKDILETRFYEKFKSTSLIKMKDVYPKIEELSERENELQKSLDKLRLHETKKGLTDKDKSKMTEINEEMKDVKSRKNKMEKLLNSLRREFFNNKLSDIDTAGDDIVNRIYERQKTVKRLDRYQKRASDESFKTTLGETITKLNDEIVELKGSLVEHFTKS